MNGENSSVLSLAPTASSSANISSNARTYPISLSAGVSANYAISLHYGTLTVTQATPALTFSADTFGVVGSTIHLMSASNSAGVVSYSLSNGTGAATLSGNILSLISPGTVTITANIIPTYNYTGESITQQININLVSFLSSQQAGLELSVYPNPVTDETRLQLGLSADCTGNLLLCDVHGRVLRVIDEGLIQRSALYTISMAQFPSGIYVLKLDTDKGSYFHKLTK